MKEDIIKMAREAGVYTAHTELTLMAGLERFAALVAERCAQIAQEAEPYQAADLIRSRFNIDPMPLFDDWPGRWK